MSSPYDGGARRVLWFGLAFIAARSLVEGAGTLRALAAGPGAHPLAPRWLLALGGSTAAIFALTAVGLGALALFAWRRAPLVTGGAALAVLALFAEAHAALTDGPKRNEFAAGAALAGWLCGLAYARALRPGRRPPNDGDDGDDALAEAGGAAALAATYVVAGLSKLAEGGLGWTDALALRALLFTQRPVDDVSLGGAWAHAIATHPALARALSAATIVIQLGAVHWALGRRGRWIWGTLLLAFHLNVAILTDIHYRAAFSLVALFSYPWWRLLRAPAPPPPPVDAERVRRVGWRAALIAAALVALAWLAPVRRYTALHFRHWAGERR